MHVAHPHRSRVAGIEAVSLTSSHVFPRHSHDQFGIGILTEGAQRSWSGIGPVEAEAGDVITVNPGEIHDGAPMGDRPRSWRMLYFEPSVVLGETQDEAVGTVEIARPALQDLTLARIFSQLFRVVTEPGSDPLAVEQCARFNVTARGRPLRANAPRAC
jgi:quercetin dioxygenase-like cupin family protein